MPSVNELLLDEAIRHQVALLQYGNDVVRRMITILNRADVPLFADLMAQLERLTPSEFNIARLESMLGSVRAMNAAAMGNINQELTGELRNFVEYEAGYKAQLLESFVGLRVSVAAINASEVYAAAVEMPFQGTLLRAALEDVGVRRARQIQQTVSQGWVENLTNDQIIRQLRGTRALGYADGLMERPRREVAAIVQTATSHMAGFVADKAAAANADIVKAIRWSAKLDRRTSPGCRLRDGLLYDPVSHKPIGHEVPWSGGPGRLHWNCRSGGVEVLKSFKELGIPLPEINVAGTRASMDGQVPADTTYLEWLQRQPAVRQDEVLGPTRGKLLRRGGLRPDQMYSGSGQYLNLEQLRARDAAVFTRAGL